MSAFADRIVRAARFDPSLYEEVEADQAAFPQAAATVVLSSVAAGLGLLWPGVGLEGLFWGTVAALVGWVAWACVICFVGTQLLPGSQTSSNVGEVLRCIGFASAPGLIRVLGVFAPIRPVIFLVASVWMLAATIVAVRQALDYSSTLKAAVVCLIGWVIQILVLVAILRLSGAPTLVVTR